MQDFYHKIMTDKEKIKQYLENKGISKSEFYRKTGLSVGFLDSGNSLGVDKAKIIINNYPDLNVKWLVLDQGDMIDDAEILPVKNYERKGCPYFNVDFRAGFDLLVNNQTTLPEYFIDFLPYNTEGALWCNATGESMKPEINNGDFILIKEVYNWLDYIDFNDIYGIVTSNGFRTIKRIAKGTSKDTYSLIPTNPSYDKQEINKSLILHIFRVLCAFKRF